MRTTTGLLTLATVLLTGCSGTTLPTADRMEMRAYDVPPETTQDVQRALRDSFATGEKTFVGNVGVIAPGRLVVMAPANLQDSIATSLKQIVRTPATNDKGLQLRVQFWSVDAMPGKDGDAAPAELNDALAQARASLGDVHFVLRDQAGGVTAAGRQVEQSWINSDPGSAPNSLQYTVSGNVDALSVTLRYVDQTPLSGDAKSRSNSHSSVSVTLPVKMGQTVVLSQSPVVAADATLRAARLYLVRAEAVK